MIRNFKEYNKINCVFVYIESKKKRALEFEFIVSNIHRLSSTRIETELQLRLYFKETQLMNIYRKIIL